MTIGQKITELRVQKGITQEELAERLDVSRQSISKWEIDSALPQVDKILSLCDFF
ncbi:MAG: helix-turn-helix transcriptional regulator, partial [Clostridia bacterium]|nr:helix-turn-helix transcriptional regulator [Clostridia bacterium]